MLNPNTCYPIPKISRGVVFLKNLIQNPNISVGDFTYYDGRSDPEKFEEDNVIFAHSCKLIIGKFCQIAYGTKFIMSDANHQMSGFSTYPFFIFAKGSNTCPEWGNYPLDLPNQGDTLIGHDVWFGHESTIMPRVTIGNGAIIGAKAVVTKDVPPYAIVAGNPAKVIRERFSKDITKALEKIEWWNWPYEKITRNISAIVSADLEKLYQSE
jgi:virginiamycin A acetyltransferase